MMSSAAAICIASAQVSISNRTASRWMTSASIREAAAVPSRERSGWRGSWALQTEWEGAGGLMDKRAQAPWAGALYLVRSAQCNHFKRQPLPAECRLPHVHQAHVLRLEGMEVVKGRCCRFGWYSRGAR